MDGDYWKFHVAVNHQLILSGQNDFELFSALVQKQHGIVRDL